MTDDLHLEIGRLQGRLDALERGIAEREKVIDGQLAEINRKLDRLTEAFNMGRGGAIAAAKLGGVVLLLLAGLAWLADRLPAWPR